MSDANAELNPWHPMAEPVDKKHLLKLIEEVNELGSAAARCLMQGLYECEPETGKVNVVWLEEEMADVMANVELVIAHFTLDRLRIGERATIKRARLRTWHAMA